MKYISKRLAIISAILLPSIVFAQGKTLRDLVNTFTDYLQLAISLIISLAIVSFVWNVYRYFFTSDVGGDKKKEAGLYVLYSTVGFFVILSIWGFVAILRNTFKLPDNRPAWPFTGTNGTPGSGGTGSNAGNIIPPAANYGNTGNTIPPASNTGNTGNVIPSAANTSGAPTGEAQNSGPMTF